MRKSTAEEGYRRWKTRGNMAQELAWDNDGETMGKHENKEHEKQTNDQGEKTSILGLAQRLPTIKTQIHEHVSPVIDICIRHAVQLLVFWLTKGI